MATVVIMPKQGQSVESCIITEWNKKKGDQVTKGEILFAYETDKASFEEEAAVDGILLELFYEAGDEVPVLTNVCVIGAAGESAEAYRPGGAAEKNVEISETVVKQEATTAKTEELISKVVNQEAATGSGLGGSVTAKDLTTPNPVYSNDFEIKKLSNMRKMIAKAMLSSLQNSAQLTHHLGADARRMLELRRKVKKANDNGYPVNITINDMVCFAVVKALRKFPQANGHFLGDSVKYFNKIHLGVAVDTDRGLMVPAIRNADDLSIQGLSNQMREIAVSCRKGAINPELLSSEAASFTVSNLGNYGVEMFTPVINLPQVGILGVNTIVPRPKDLGDGVYGFVPFIGLSLTYDHQALDGGEATRFLKQIAIEIENLEFEL